MSGTRNKTPRSENNAAEVGGLCYLKNENLLLTYVFNAFKEYFSDCNDFHDFFQSISTDERKDKFLRLAYSYNFLVKDDVLRQSRETNPREETYKFIALISLMEALHSEEEFVDFYSWLTTKEPFPIVANKKELEKLRDEYIKQHGTTQKAIRFFDNLDDDCKKLFREKFKVKSKIEISQLARRLYEARSQFVHTAEVILLFGQGTNFAIGHTGKVEVISTLKIEHLKIFLEHGLLLYFGYLGELKHFHETSCTCG